MALFLLVVPGSNAINVHQKSDSLVVYSASWCGPCQILKPKLAKLKKLGFKIYILDVDKLKKDQWRPKAVPTIQFFDGKKNLGNQGLHAGSSIMDFRGKFKPLKKRKPLTIFRFVK